MEKIGIFTDFLYPKSSTVDNILGWLISKYELSDVKFDKYYVILVFKGGISAKILNTCDPSTWASTGSVKKGSDEFHRWNNMRPSRKTMNRMLKIINAYMTDKITRML